MPPRANRRQLSRHPFESGFFVVRQATFAVRFIWTDDVETRQTVAVAVCVGGKENVPVGAVSRRRAVRFVAGEKTADGAVLIAVKRHQGPAQGGEHIGASGGGRGVALNGEDGNLAEDSLFRRHQPEPQIAAIADEDGAVARRGESDFDMPQAVPGEARVARERFGARASGAEGFALHADRRDRCLDTGMAQGLANGVRNIAGLLRILQ